DRYNQERCCETAHAETLKTIRERGEQISNREAGDKRQHDFAEQPQHQDEQQQSCQPKQQLPMDESGICGSAATQARWISRAHDLTAVELICRTHSAT